METGKNKGAQMKLPKPYLDYVEKLGRLFQAKMLLMEYEFEWKHMKTMPDKRYFDGYTAEVYVDTRYMIIKIALSGKFYKRWKRKEYKEMAELMAHELAHIYTDPYYEFFWDAVPPKMKKQVEHLNEQQTERLSKLIMINVRPIEYLP